MKGHDDDDVCVCFVKCVMARNILLGSGNRLFVRSFGWNVLESTFNYKNYENNLSRLVASI